MSSLLTAASAYRLMHATPLERSADGRFAMASAQDVLLVGNTIAARGAACATASPPGTVAIDCTGLLLLPGLINAHTHSPETFRRGLAADSTGFDSWMDAVWPPIERLTSTEVNVAVTLGAIEMLKRGTTTVVDHFRQVPQRADAVEAALAAYEAVGLRAVVAVMLRDRDERSGEPSRGTQPASEQAALCADIARRHTGRFASVGVGPSGPGRCSDTLLLAAAEQARAAGLALHMHVNETAAQAKDARTRYGCSAVAHLDDLGFLGPDVALAHCVWVDADDIDRLSRTGTAAIHNPAANMRLGSGRAPVAALINAGVTVALGSDGPASNDSLDVLEAAKLAVLLSRSVAGDEKAWLGCAAALDMLINGGRRAAGQPTASLAPGAVADLALVELDSPPLVPLHDPAAQLVLGGPAISVRHVFVDGAWVLRDGAVPHVDAAALCAEARAIAGCHAPNGVTA
jgi:5-methylthioadenosine/S-adenosylhomocysteine deaminase